MGGRLVKMSTATENLQMENAVERVFRQFDRRELNGNEAQEDLTEPNLVVDEDNEFIDQTGEEDLEVSHSFFSFDSIVFSYYYLVQYLGNFSFTFNFIFHALN